MLTDKVVTKANARVFEKWVGIWCDWGWVPVWVWEVNWLPSADEKSVAKL